MTRPKFVAQFKGIGIFEQTVNMELTLSLAYTAFFVWYLRRSPFYRLEGIPNTWVAGAFLAKVLAGTALGWIYFHYYKDPATSDTIKFFNDSGILFDSLRDNPKHFLQMLTGIGGKDPALQPYYVKMNAWLNTDVLFNDNKTIIRLNTVFRFFSLGHYYVHVVLINVLSFTGLIALYRLFAVHLRKYHQLLFFGIFFLPSLLFWGSGVLKDGIVLFALGVLTYTVHRALCEGWSSLRLVTVVITLFLMLATKFYVLGALLPGVVVWLTFRDRPTRFGCLYVLIAYGLFFLIGFNLYRIDNTYNLSDLLYYKQLSFLNLAKDTQAGSVVNIPEILPNCWSILSQAPVAILQSLIRPSMGAWNMSSLVKISILENTLFLISIAFLMIANRKQLFFPRDPFSLLCLFFSMVLLALMGLTTPVLGALVRYKIVVLPFLIYFLLRALSGHEIADRN